MILRPFRLLLLSCLLVVSASPAAGAGTYDVVACDAAPDGLANNAWSYSESATGRLEHGDGCGAAAGTEYAGLYVREDLTQNASIPAGTNAYWSFTAATGTSIAALTYSRHLRTYLDDGWRSELRADAAVLEDCVVPTMGDECDRGATGGTSMTFSGLNAAQLRIGVRCAPISPATACTDGSSLQRVIAAAYGLNVTVNDPDGPTLGALGGALLDGGWLRGPQAVSFSAQDVSGIDRLELIRDGGVVLTDDRPCDYTKPAPCSDPGAPTAAGWTTVDTTAWSDGTHTVAARASDAAENEATTPGLAVRVDNTAPVPPTVSADSAWSRSADASWSWTVPANLDRAPIDRVELETCRDAVCSAEVVPSSGAITATRSVDEGTTTLRARHRDAAGNQGGWSKPIAVRRDRTPPPQPTLGAPTRLAKDRYRVPVSLTNPGPAPIDRLEGKACPTPVGDCRGLSSTSLSQIEAGALAPGRWNISVRAVDAAGNVGSDASARVAVPRRRSQLKLTSVRVTGSRVFVRGRVASKATGRVRCVIQVGTAQRARAAGVRKGRFRTALARPIGQTRRLRLRTRYSGDALYLPASRTRVVKLSTGSQGAGRDPSAASPLAEP